MHIVVTVPRSERANIKAEDKFVEKHTGVEQAWKVSNVPKHLLPGDRVYFIEDGVIRYYHTFRRVEKDFRCEVTGRVWHGNNLILFCPEVKLRQPVPMKGFRGFRYAEKEWE
jgi:hypothetical protein